MVRPSVVNLLIIRSHSLLQNLDLAIFSSQEALSLHFSFKLEVTINLLSPTGSLAILVFCMRTYARTLPDFTTTVQSLETRPHKVKRIIMSQLWLRMVRPWPDQPDRFRHLCVILNMYYYRTRLYHDVISPYHKDTPAHSSETSGVIGPKMA